MNFWTSAFGDGTGDVMRQLLTTSVPGQLNMKGTHWKMALSDTSVCALLLGKLNFVLLTAFVFCLPYRLLRSHHKTRQKR